MCEIMNKIAAEERAEGRAEGFMNALVQLAKEHVLSIADAANRVNMTEEEFTQLMASNTMD